MVLGESSTRTRLSALAVVAVAGALVLFSGVPAATADGVISPYESSLADKAHSSICAGLNDGAATITPTARYGTVSSIVGAIQDGTGLAWGDAGDVVQAVAERYCPEHLPYLSRVQDLLQGQQ